jgi:aspartate carbamoyltransferase catalytic subunit
MSEITLTIDGKQVKGKQGDTVLDVCVANGIDVPTLCHYQGISNPGASFELAAKYLSADTVSLDAARSSVAKGESLIDTLRTLQSLGVDVIIMRHSCSGAPYIAAQHIEASIINAGDGWHAHPSQSLLDLFTLRRHLGELKGRKLVIVGDIMHSRVARSNIWGAAALGVKLTLCAPATLIPRGLPEMLNQAKLAHVTLETSLDTAVQDADAIMALRLQKERQESGLISSVREYIQHYQLNPARMAKAKPGALVLHPGPMNEGVEISHNIAYSSQSLIEEQVTNGVAIRMALLYLVAGGKNR